MTDEEDAHVSAIYAECVELRKKLSADAEWYRKDMQTRAMALGAEAQARAAHQQEAFELAKRVKELEDQKNNAVREMDACHNCWDQFTEIVCKAIPEMSRAPLFQQGEKILEVIGSLRVECANRQAQVGELLGKLDEAQKAIAAKDEALRWLVGPKHEGACEYSDKVDEGCHLCKKAENEGWHKVEQALSPDAGKDFIRRSELKSVEEALTSAQAVVWDGHYSGKGVEVGYAQAVDKEIRDALQTLRKEAL